MPGPRGPLRRARALVALLAAALSCTSCASLLGAGLGTAIDRHRLETKIPPAGFGALEPGTRVLITLTDGECVQGKFVEVVHDGDAVRALRVRVDPPSRRSLTSSADLAAQGPREMPLGEIRALVRRKPGLGSWWIFTAAGATFDVWVLYALASMN